MLITKPAYFDDFHCIASACPDSCCKEWSVQVDADTAAFYRGLPGPLGDRLREVLQEEDGDTVMTIENGRCPMWRSDGLCQIQAELGEQALCHTCREFPRLTHDYGDFVELGLELSCPEAARILLSAEPAPAVVCTIPGGSAPEYDAEAMESLKHSRNVMLSLLSDQRYTIPEVLSLGLLYGYQAQGELDGDEAFPFDANSALEQLSGFAKPGNLQEVLDFFLGLEILTPVWAQRLREPARLRFPEAARQLARYFVERYWLQAVSDYDLTGRVKFVIISCLVICALGGDFVSTAQLYSKEIENNWDNVDSILEASYSHPAFTDDRLLGLLLSLQDS